jgi:stalled ribosome rescue protein Dom34
MNKQVGLWIDHRKAVVVAIAGETSEMNQISSDVEKHVRYMGGAEASAPEDQVDRRFQDHLRAYYDEVIARVRDAESILVMGPGEAKGEFVKRLQSERLGDRIVGVETVDKMTDNQIVASVRKRFRE